MTPLTLPPIPLSPFSLLPQCSVQHPACCCVPGWASSSATAKGTAPTPASPSNTPFPRDNPSLGGNHHPEFHGYQARTTRRRGSSLISKSLTLQDGCGLGDKQVTQSTCIPLWDPAPGALLDHLQVLQACWEVGEKKNGEPMYSHLHISKNSNS